jgi:TonB family protein
MLWRIFLCGLLLAAPLTGSAYSQEQGAPPAPPATSQAEQTPSTAASTSTTPHPVRIRIGGEVAAAVLTHVVQREYPDEAKKNNIRGTVSLHIVVANDGTIRTVEYVSGPHELMDVSIEAVKQWRYKPVLLNNRPVEVDTTINVIFALDKKGNLKPQPRIH